MHATVRKTIPRKETFGAGDILQGTLDMLIRRTLILGPAQGHTIAQVIEHTSENTREIEQGSLYPRCTALKIVACGHSEWSFSENNRKRSSTRSPRRAGGAWPAKQTGGAA
jgi:PadR family transcriptional regulator, regulatory protein PadR